MTPTGCAGASPANLQDRRNEEVFRDEDSRSRTPGPRGLSSGRTSSCRDDAVGSGCRILFHLICMTTSCPSMVDTASPVPAHPEWIARRRSGSECWTKHPIGGSISNRSEKNFRRHPDNPLPSATHPSWRAHHSHERVQQLDLAFAGGDPLRMGHATSSPGEQSSARRTARNPLRPLRRWRPRADPLRIFSCTPRNRRRTPCLPT
jgi:hypothetical protein